LSGAYLFINAASCNGEILHAHECRPCEGHVLSFMYRGRRYENNDIFLKMRACKLWAYTFAAVCCLYQLAGWLAAWWAATVTWQACRYLF